MSRLLASLLALSSFGLACPFGIGQDRDILALEEGWEFRQEGDETWKPVEVFQSWEEHEGVEFDGVGHYRHRLPNLKVQEGERVFIQFDGVATEATVSLGEKVLGTHLGGWTPFRVELTEHLPITVPLEIRVDEKVGHNSQGFLPIIAPHFGGLWKPAFLVVVRETFFDDLSLGVRGSPSSGSIECRGTLVNPLSTHDYGLTTRLRILGNRSWGPRHHGPLSVADNGDFSVSIPVPGFRLWRPEDPVLYEVEWSLISRDPSQDSPLWLDTVKTRVAFRTTTIEADKILLNGSPLVVRGLLNWGYAPPKLSPSLEEEFMRQEIERAQALGFNLIKFCLWVPPKRYLELADEMGMLTWMEYPTWHSEWSARRRLELRREFLEFFHYDRNHPSIILRSLTCETGPSADIEVIRELYDLCHEVIPGSIVEDDSSWIAWNRVHDFYDDHPYGNNHTWKATLDRLDQHMAENGIKPLVLGECISADTWTDAETYRDDVGEERPFWLPRHFDANQQWADQRRAQDGNQGVDQLSEDSLHYGHRMRKFQIETFRSQMPSSGYVISVIRDMPLASMGLIDYGNELKWSPDAWNWHRNRTVLVQSEGGDHRFSLGEQSPLRFVWALHQSREDSDQPVHTRTRVSFPDGTKIEHAQVVHPKSGALVYLPGPEGVVYPQLSVETPTRLELAASVNHEWINQWHYWVIPKNSPPTGITLHADLDLERLPPSVRAAGHESSSPPDQPIVLASRFDSELLDHLEQGGTLLLLPDGERGSFPTRDHWFLRGGPYLRDHPLVQRLGRELLLDLQHFDLASSVVYDIDYLDQVTSIAMLWDNHDLDHTKTHGLLFETRVGKGRLFVSSLNHADSPAGEWVMSQIVDYLHHSDLPTTELSLESRSAIRQKLTEKKLSLVERPWRFKVDAEQTGLEQDWAQVQMDETWTEIRIGTHWESQGHEALDGWAWYRIDVAIPKDWPAQELFLCLEGADDYYEIFIDGELIGSGGDIENRQTAFDEAKSHSLGNRLKPGVSAQVAIRVYDWYGAGGLFRPIWLSNAPIPSLEIIR